LGVFDRERSRKTTPSNLEISTADGRTIAAIASIHKETRHLNHAPRPLASQQSVESDAEPGYNTGPNGNGFVTATPRPGSSTPAPSRASVSSPHPNIPSDFPPGVCHLQPWRNNRLSAPTIRFVAKLPSLPPPLPHPLPFHGSPTSTTIRGRTLRWRPLCHQQTISEPIYKRSPARTSRHLRQASRNQRSSRKSAYSRLRRPPSLPPHPIDFRRSAWTTTRAAAATRRMSKLSNSTPSPMPRRPARPTRSTEGTSSSQYRRCGRRITPSKRH
jgi:hypothetical protein